MTISTPQPEYITETHEVVDEALEQREQPASSEEHFKLVPTPADWMNARWHNQAQHLIECPLCYTAVVDSAIDEHTAWHQKLLDIVQLLAG